MDKFLNYLKAQMDKTTAWIGAIGLVLLFLGFHSALFLLFLALIVMPEAQFSSLFKEWAQQIKAPK